MFLQHYPKFSPMILPSQIAAPTNSMCSDKFSLSGARAKGIVGGGNL